MFERFKRALAKRNQQASCYPMQSEYLRALHQIRQMLNVTSDAAEQSAILDYAIKAVKLDLIGEGLAQLIYHDEVADLRSGIPIPFRFLEVGTAALDLEKTDVLAIPWDRKKLAYAITDLYHAAFDSRLSNYTADYYPEIDLTLISNGIHHSAVASIARGTIHKYTICHMTPAFDVLATDGATWTDAAEPSTFRACDFRFPLLFTLAKMRYDL